MSDAIIPAVVSRRTVGVTGAPCYVGDRGGNVFNLSVHPPRPPPEPAYGQPEWTRQVSTDRLPVSSPARGSTFLSNELFFREAAIVLLIQRIRMAFLQVISTSSYTWAAESSKDVFMADIVDTAVGAGSFKTLVAAVTAAGLVETLKGAGPFTVLAPADTAFAKLPAGTVESLVKSEAKATLTGILTYHVIAGKHLAADVMKMTSAATVNGQSVDIKVADGKVHVGGATVVTADIICDNGVIHVIDTVLMPK
jgi:uncharacterized surface protein with fasciclin (FAS1) repeats